MDVIARFKRRSREPLLQGFARPVVDLSRGASVDDIVATSVITLAADLVVKGTDWATDATTAAANSTSAPGCPSAP